jgi:hypothetical protein
MAGRCKGSAKTGSISASVSGCAQIAARFLESDQEAFPAPAIGWLLPHKNEAVPYRGEALFEKQIILDYAIVGEVHLAGAIDLRVSVVF